MWCVFNALSWLLTVVTCTYAMPRGCVSLIWWLIIICLRQQYTHNCCRRHVSNSSRVPCCCSLLMIDRVMSCWWWWCVCVQKVWVWSWRLDRSARQITSSTSLSLTSWHVSMPTLRLISVSWSALCSLCVVVVSRLSHCLTFFISLVTRRSVCEHWACSLCQSVGHFNFWLSLLLSLSLS